MNIKSYFSNFQTHKELNIIGPLFDGYNQLHEPVIYVDGGTKAKLENGGFSIGDGDSFFEELDEYLPKEKDYSDLSYVLDTIPSHFEVINLLGFLGERKDHELINLAEVHRFLTNISKSKKVIFDQEIIAFSAGEWSLPISGTFTLFAFDDINIQLSGSCKYHILKKLKPLSSEGLSNIGDGLINFKNDAPVFLFLSAIL